MGLKGEGLGVRSMGYLLTELVEFLGGRGACHLFLVRVGVCFPEACGASVLSVAEVLSVSLCLEGGAGWL